MSRSYSHRNTHAFYPCIYILFLFFLILSIAPVSEAKRLAYSPRTGWWFYQSDRSKFKIRYDKAFINPTDGKFPCYRGKCNISMYKYLGFDIFTAKRFLLFSAIFSTYWHINKVKTKLLERAWNQLGGPI